MSDLNPALLRRLRPGEALEVTPDLLALAREFRATPIGHHSPNLQALLRLFRGQPVAGKHAILCTRPNREWMLVQLSGSKEKPLTLHADVRFHSLEEAEWEIFKLRWKDLTGRELAIEHEAD